MALNFKKAEQELKELVERDCTSPEIYNRIHDITFNYLYNVLKPGSDLYDYEVISCDIAADLFLRVINGAKIEFWLNYISKILKMYYLREYQKQNWSVVIDTAGDNSLEQNIKQGFMDSSSSKNKIDKSLNVIYLEQFELILNKVLYSSKFGFNSKERVNLQISVLLTLLKNKPVYFRIDESLKPFINLIISQVKNEIINSGMFTYDNTMDTLDLDPLRINEPDNDTY